MASLVGDKRNVKIFVLYLMQNINYPMDFVTLNDIVMQNDYVMYLDFAESFYEMLDSGLVEEICQTDDGDPMYMVTDKGRIVATELHSEILTSILSARLRESTIIEVFIISVSFSLRMQITSYLSSSSFSTLQERLTPLFLKLR